MPVGLYQTWQESLAAYWLRKGYGGRWLRSLGALKDEAQYRAFAANAQRFPDFAADDALAQLFAERQLERASGSTAVQAATKLKQAFDRWYWGGTPYGLLRELVEATPGAHLSDFKIILQTQQDAVAYSVNNPITGDPLVDMQYLVNGWGSPQIALSDPIRFNTFIVQIALFTTHPWHGAVPDDSSNEANTARRVIQRWRPQHAECRRIIVQDCSAGWAYRRLWGMYDWSISDFVSWGDGGTWGQAPAGSSTTYWTPPVQ